MTASGTSSALVVFSAERSDASAQGRDPLGRWCQFWCHLTYHLSWL